MLPQDPVILLSVVNARLRDLYPDLDELCHSEDADRAQLEEKLAAVQNALDHSRRTLAFYEIAAKTGSEETANELYLARYGEADE